MLVAGCPLLRIRKISDCLASVDFLDERGVPVNRPCFNDAPAEAMIARYDDFRQIDGSFTGYVNDQFDPWILVIKAILAGLRKQPVLRY